jgi:hypothetical protein
MTQSRSNLADKKQKDLNEGKDAEGLKQIKVHERSKSQSSDFHGTNLGESRVPQ